MKDEIEKITCRNERQIRKKIEEGAKHIIAYGDVKVSKEVSNMIKEKQIKVIAIERRKKKNKASKSNNK